FRLGGIGEIVTRLSAGAVGDLARYDFPDSAKAKLAALDVALDLFTMFGARPFGHNDHGARVTGSFARFDDVGDLVVIEWNFGDQDDIGAAGPSAVQPNPSRVAPHHFDHHDARDGLRCTADWPAAPMSS